MIQWCLSFAVKFRHLKIRLWSDSDIVITRFDTASGKCQICPTGRAGLPVHYRAIGSEDAHFRIYV